MSAQLATQLETASRATPQNSAATPHLRLERRVLVAVRWPVGGIRTHILYNYPIAAKEGFRFTFVGPADETFDHFSTSLRDLHGSEFLSVRVRGPRCRMWPRLCGLLCTGRFSLLHSHGLTAACHGVIAAFGTSVPHLATVHDVLRPEQFPGWRGHLKQWLMGRLLRRVDNIILPGNDVHDNLVEFLPALRAGPCQRHVIPNGINSAHFAGMGQPATELRQRLSLSADTLLVGFLGRFMEQKGFLPLLSAIEQVVALGLSRRFHIVAFGSGDYAREYWAHVQKRNLTSWISMFEAIPDAQPVLRQLDLLVMPSLWEALPLLPMEAMAAGVPVLGTDCPGLREVLRDTPSRMVPAGNVEALAGALREAITAPWTAAARAFAPIACQRFDNTYSARLLLDLFEQTTARAEAHSP
jgi:glycosyltransferase involved in cell wall biosynthesis